MSLTVKPVELRDANAFVTRQHRHHDPVQGHKFSLGAYEGESLCGVAIVGRPVARRLDDGATLEVTRLCTDGTRNACSLLYSAAARAAQAMGYARIVTYTFATENGASLRASGWERDGESPGGSWSKPSRPREHPADLFGATAKDTTAPKVRWLRRLNRRGAA